ncbi:MAG: nicotinate (nicotinamide) nucleotide adenylyltransferase [Cytophagales bacterium]|nr:nicotinate (nicotinamide) nucleotide adenylyltransferase [Cytophagales bacterium]
MKKNIGIYGGAFDPPHLAHVALARAAMTQFNLDELRVIPTGDAVHKRRVLSPAYHRVAMAELAFADLPRVVIDPCEVNRGGASYTIDTLIELRAAYPDAHFTLIIGQDQLTAFHTWQRYQDVLQMATLAVAVRGGSSPVALAIPYSAIDFAPQTASSSDIRQMVRLKDAQFAAKMSPSVATYIQAHALYTTH